MKVKYMLKEFNKLLAILAFSLLLTGCWDYRDVNRRSINLSLGVDVVDSKIEFTGEIAKLASNELTTKGQAQITDVYKYRAIGKNYRDARGDYDAKLTHPSFLGALRVVVFSKKYAENIGIESYINRINFNNEFRNSVLIAVSEIPTDNLFSGKVENDICIGYAIENTVRSLYDEGVALYKTAQDILANIQTKQIGYLLPYMTKEKNVAKYLGLAAFKESKLVGIIKIGDTNGYLFILLKKPSMITAIPHPSNEKNLINTKTTLKSRTIKTTYEDKKINIYIDLILNTQIQYEYTITPISKDDTKKIEQIISDKIKKDVLSALNRSKDEFQSDVFNFADIFRAQNHKDFKKIDWKKDYLNTAFHVNVKNIIINTGTLDPNAKKPD